MAKQIVGDPADLRLVVRFLRGEVNPPEIAERLGLEPATIRKIVQRTRSPLPRRNQSNKPL
jgi:hypothetical protein